MLSRLPLIVVTSFVFRIFTESLSNNVRSRTFTPSGTVYTSCWTFGLLRTEQIVLPSWVRMVISPVDVSTV